MSLAVPSSREVGASLTVTQFRRALAVVAVVLGVGCVIYAVEKYVLAGRLLASRRRFMESPTEVMVRAFALAHFIIGWLFLFTSPRLRDRAALVRVGTLTLAGVGICFLYSEGGASKNPIILIGFYSLFLLHEVRDEKNMYQVYAHVPADAHGLLSSLSLTVSLLLVGLMAVLFLIHQYLFDPRGRVSYYPALVPWACVGLVIAGCVCSGRVTLGLARRSGLNLEGLIEAHAPLFGVYAGIFGILFLGSLLGSVGFNLIVLLHAAAWLVFVSHQLGRKQHPPANLWAWLRRTPAGFVTLHLVLVTVILALMAARVHVWERAGPVSVLLASSSLPYWSLMHIAMGFWKGH